MLFNSLEFIFLFLPITLFVFYKVPPSKPTHRMRWLIFASLLFYAWWNPIFILLLIGSILANFIIAREIITQQKQKKRLYLIIGIALNLSLIAFFKYANFFVDSINFITSTHFHLETIILPLAISFFTFQQIAYLVDAYQEKISSHRFDEYCLFVTFFPQLIAGPIVHHNQIIPQMNKAFKTNKRFIRNISIGISIFMIGLAKKIIIADSLAIPANTIFTAASSGISLTFFESWMGALCYTFQLYFDFSGYSDMAIGLAYLFGIRLPVNFNSPYQAANIIDFWRRWHMTLSTFLRDYLYIPLGGNQNGIWARYKNLMLTMLLGGLWHGAGINFIIWGGLHGTYLIINHAWRYLFPKSLKAKIPLYNIWSTGLTFLSVVIAWVIFRSNSLFTTSQMFKSMFGLEGISLPKRLHIFGFEQVPMISHLSISYNGMFYNELMNWHPVIYMLIICSFIAFVMPNTQTLFRKIYPFGLSTQNPPLAKNLLAWAPTQILSIILGLLSIICLTLLSKPSEFLYYQF